MKKITIPDDVMLRDPTSNEEVRSASFKDWMRSTVLVDARWGKSAQKIILASDLMRRIGEANGVWELNDAEYHDIKDVVENPSNGYNVPVAIQVVSFIDAVLNCSSS